MIKVIIQVTKIIVAVILAIIIQSCGNNYDFNRESINGTNNVTTVKRNIQGNFTSIEAKNGLDVIIEQGSSIIVQVEADDNLHSHIFTEVKDSVLIVYTDANFVKTKLQKVYIQLPHLNSIKSSSGAAVKSANELKCEKLTLDSSSGSEMDVFIKVKNLNCESSSGSEIIVVGEANNLSCDSSSGSEINAGKLMAINAKANSSSGSSIILNVSENLTAEASSGSSIEYLSKPIALTKDESSGGSVDLK